MVMRKLKRLMRFGKGEVFYAGGRGEKTELKREGFRYEPDLMKAFDADAVSLHLTYIPGVTENIITAKHLGQMRQRGILINNARAELVNPDNVRMFLSSRLYEGVSCIFDVFWKEGGDFQNLRHVDHMHDENRVYRELIQLPNLRYTGHSAALHEQKWTQQEY